MGEGSIDDADILRIDILLQFYAVFPVEAVLDELMFEVYLVKDCIRIWLLTSREWDDLKVLGCSLEEAEGIGPYGDVAFLVTAVGYIDLDIIRAISLQLAVEESLV